MFAAPPGSDTEALALQQFHETSYRPVRAGGNDYHDDDDYYPPHRRPPREPERPKQPTLEELFDELNSLIGLENVKHDLAEMVDFLRVQQLREERGHKTVPTSRHLVFYGNPGTGKTTVARLLGGIYRALGILSRGHMVETDRAGMVAGYVGQTAQKVTRVVNEALGGATIFQLPPSPPITRARTTSAGAVATLLKVADHRDDLVVTSRYLEKMCISLRPTQGWSRASTSSSSLTTIRRRS